MSPPPPIPGPTEGLNAAVAAQIRAEAAASQLSDKALAIKAGVNYASLRRWLGRDIGNERHIDLALLSTLAEALELTPLEIIRRAEARMHVSEARPMVTAEDLVGLPSAAEPERTDGEDDAQHET